MTIETSTVRALAKGNESVDPEARDLLTQATEQLRAGKLSEAEALARKAAEADPLRAENWNMLGVLLRMQGRAEQAVWCYRRALAIDPRRASPWSNLGNALKDLKQLETSIACHRRAIALARPDAGILHNLGIALAMAERSPEAIDAFDRALALDPDNAEIRWDRARSYLQLGDYVRGWIEYESRLLTGRIPKRDIPGVPWRGEPFKGRRLLLLSEQGFGDTIWVARYLPHVKALGGELLVECRRELIPLVATMGVADRLVAKGEPLPDADLHLHICSLPGLFTSNFRMIPPAPYLTAPSDRREKFAAAMARGGGRLRVGIVWSGSVTFGGNRDRAVPLKQFLQFFALPSVQLYSLQKGPPEEELKALPPQAPIVDLAPLLQDFADTAAAVDELDLVIMTDSAVAHLAGALGRPVWVLLNRGAHWLWLDERADTPWYPSMRLFRPKSWDDWTGVFDAAAAELMNLVATRKRRGGTAP